MFKIAPRDPGIPNQPWLSRRAAWLHKVQSKVMQKWLTPQLQLRVYMTSYERRARRLGRGGPSDTVGALIDNTIRRIIHREVLPRAMRVMVAGALASLFLAVSVVSWCWHHGNDLERMYVAARGLPLLSPAEQREGVAGQLVRKAGTDAKGRLLDFFRKKRDDSRDSE